MIFNIKKHNDNFLRKITKVCNWSKFFCKNEKRYDNFDEMWKIYNLKIGFNKKSRER